MDINIKNIFYVFVAWFEQAPVFQTWPQEITKMKECTMAFYDSMKKVCHYMFRILAMALDIKVANDPNKFSKFMFKLKLKSDTCNWLDVCYRRIQNILTSIIIWERLIIFQTYDSCATREYQKVVSFSSLSNLNQYLWNSLPDSYSNN